LTDYAIRTGLKILPQAWHDLLEIGFVYSRQGKRLEASAVTCSIVSKLKELQDFAMLGNKTPLSSLNEKKYLMLMISMPVFTARLKILYIFIILQNYSVIILN